ncbi:alpha-hydroxy-acid oxidizing enzyme [Marivivens niveibacter]|uniref:Alpha-hydroxy-acid oxidizing enzyme n=1 Tax=Marivivens niveibacter TaxID=1930667 RepID=A0A251WWC0_9RHOB|nr:alpha-hydroxy acid oxidase [Marivivens niveibacter]OUD08364.1 alpha-hydroxy-acid oxidizing enzyme [Marivivens niveibacter]
MRLSSCHNFHDFQKLAKRRLPSPLYNYIAGGADDELTLRENTASFDRVDLVPNVLRGVENVDLSTTVMGQKIDLPVYLSPTALQRLFHHQGERATAAAAEKFGTMFGVSTIGTVAMEELAAKHSNPQCYQFYFHKDRGLNSAMMQAAKNNGIKVMMLTVDTITGGNRERDLRTGFSIPLRLNMRGMLDFVLKPQWGINYVTHEKFSLPQLEKHIDIKGDPVSIGKYLNDMLDASMNWDDVEKMVREWDGQFCLKGVMSVDDATRAADIGCTGIVLSNHGGRQLDGSRTAFDQLDEIVQAVGDRMDVMIDGGIQRGTHVLKALALGAKAVGLGRFYLFPLAAAGQAGIERAVGKLRDELVRDMQLMGCTSIDQLNRDMLRFR